LNPQSHRGIYLNFDIGQYTAIVRIAIHSSLFVAPFLRSGGDAEIRTENKNLISARAYKARSFSLAACVSKMAA